MKRLRKLSNITLGRSRPANILHGKNHLTSVLESARMHVFFLVDTSYCKTENDDPKDAIVYFYPPQVPESQLCALCCQMTGAVQFFRNTFSCPRIIHLSRGKFAVKVVNSYFFCLGSSSDMPENKLADSLDFLFELFTFYHQSISSVQEQCLQTLEEFSFRIQRIFKFILESACTEEKISWIAGIVPRVQNISPSVYLNAYHILQSCQRLPHVLGGCIVHDNSIVCTQLPSKVSSYLCHFQEDLFNLSRTEAEDSPQFIFMPVFLQYKDVLKTASLNEFSKTFKKPWHITDFSTEASMSGESPEAEQSEVDSSFEDSVKSTKASLFVNPKLLENCKPPPNILLTVSDEPSISRSFEGVTSEQKPEPLKFKSNSLSLLQSVTEESLRRLKLYEESERLKYKRKKSKKDAEKNVLFLSDGHDRKSDAVVDEAVHSENSVDSSFFEPKLLLESQKSDTSHKSEASLTNKNGSSRGNTTPVYLDINPDLSEIKTPTKFESGSFLGTELDKNYFHPLGIYCVKYAKTMCFIMVDQDKEDEKLAINKICSGPIKKFGSSLCTRKNTSTESSSSKHVTAVYSDHFWNSAIGDKLQKNNYQINDLQDNPNFKSITVMNMSGVAYTHSSISHKIYVENGSQGASVAGIPSPQDVMARISHLPRQKHDRMGYFLLK